MDNFGNVKDLQARDTYLKKYTELFNSIYALKSAILSSSIYYL